MADKTFSRERRICCNTNFTFSNVKGLPKMRNMKHNLLANKALKMELQQGRNATPQCRYRLVNEDFHSYQKPLYWHCSSTYTVSCRTFCYQKISIVFQGCETWIKWCINATEIGLHNEIKPLLKQYHWTVSLLTHQFSTFRASRPHSSTFTVLHHSQEPGAKCMLTVIRAYHSGTF